MPSTVTHNKALPTLAPTTPKQLTLLQAPSPSPSAPVTHNNPALRIKGEGATSEEVRGIGNGENLDKIVTFVLGGQRWLERIRSCGDEGGLGQVQLEACGMG